MSDVAVVRDKPVVPWRVPSFWCVIGLLLAAILGLGLLVPVWCLVH